MWASIAEIALFVVRAFVKDREKRAQWERDILKAVVRFSGRPPKSAALRDAWNDIIEKEKHRELRNEEASKRQ